MSLKQDIMISTLLDFELDEDILNTTLKQVEELIQTKDDPLTIKEVKELCKQYNDNDAQLAGVISAFCDDERTGVQNIIKSNLNAISKRYQERQRVHLLYTQQDEISGSKLCIGLDEVGRGPLAGPLTIAAVVLSPSQEEIQGINDSKQLSPQKREELSTEIKEKVLAYSIQHISPQYIDENGMSSALRLAFSRGIQEVDKQLEQKGLQAQVVLLDGNPMRLDQREINIIKGDATCAAISCASIIAKVERDTLMHNAAEKYPEYGWQHNAGYGSADHIDAIKKLGLTELHRKSFCKNFV